MKDPVFVFFILKSLNKCYFTLYTLVSIPTYISCFNIIHNVIVIIIAWSVILEIRHNPTYCRIVACVILLPVLGLKGDCWRKFCLLLLSSSWEGKLGWKLGDDSISSKMLGGQQQQQAGVVQHYHEEVYHQPITYIPITQLVLVLAKCNIFWLVL